jgi:hypothetical protein
MEPRCDGTPLRPGGRGLEYGRYPSDVMREKERPRFMLPALELAVKGMEGLDGLRGDEGYMRGNDEEG